jgi:hypothetical protein
MTKTENLKVLKKLEEFRIKLVKKEIHAGCPDWIVRRCQTYIAEEHFSNRVEWNAILRHEEKGREAFWGGNNYDVLLKKYPNGCTLQEAIDYFIEYGEELEALSLI